MLIVLISEKEIFQSVYTLFFIFFYLIFQAIDEFKVEEVVDKVSVVAIEDKVSDVVLDNKVKSAEISRYSTFLHLLLPMGRVR